MASTLDDRQRGATLGVLVVAWLVMVVPMVAAQEEVDSRWAPWIGCWRGLDQTAREPAQAPLLCVVPLAGEAAAVEMLTVVDGQVVSRESIVADGERHLVTREECGGWERAEFSGDSRRIYIRSELNCGASPPRTSTGVMSMVSPSEWLDVRTTEVDGQSLPWVVRYRQASRADFQAAGQGDLIETQGLDVRVARMSASIPIALDDVIEAVEKVSTETVEIWLVERADPFALDASKLIKMADAGVPPSVIDVVVAVSYPEKFVVDQGYPSGRSRAEAGGGRAYGYGVGFNPFLDPFYDPYARYGYYPYGYGISARFGFGYSGGFGYPYGGFGGIGYPYGGFGGYPYGGFGGFGGYPYGPIIVVDRGSGGGGGGGGGSSTRRGRVVSGGGYTSSGGGGSTGRSAQPRSSGSASSQSAGRASSPGRSSQAAPAPRSSSSPQSTGRRAIPRPGGGN
ncbi:MAG: hypothetical protein IID07_03545 [Gemmatimonadetes bacterium]|nr:hypothetical protein [Gemmatimonadota bacterium]